MSFDTEIGSGFTPRILTDFRAQARSVLHRRALKCPCSVNERGTSRSSCKNCRGCGYAFVNERTRYVIIRNLQLTEKFMSGGNHDSGDCMITAEADVDWGLEDIVFFPCGVSEVTTEAIKFIREGDYWVGYTHYPLVEVEYLGEWQSEDKPYIPISSDNYSTEADAYTIRLSGNYSERTEVVCTIKYQYRPAFQIESFARSMDARPVSATPCSVPQEVSLFVLMHARRLVFQKKFQNAHIGAHFLNNDYVEKTDNYA